MPNYDLSLSTAKLNKYNNCPRCFYAELVMEARHFEGIFQTLPRGIDRVLKEFGDRYAGQMPPEFAGKAPGRFLSDPVRRRKMRNWQSNIKPVVTTSKGRRVGLIGAFDELLEDCPGFSTWDWKSKGDRPKDNGAQYYQTQLDVYELMMKTEAWPTSGKGYLVYVWPESWTSVQDVAFAAEVYEMEASADRAMALIETVVDVMEGEFIPDSSATCDLCRYVNTRKSLNV